jgi:hypothetical protein
MAPNSRATSTRAATPFPSPRFRRHRSDAAVAFALALVATFASWSASAEPPPTASLSWVELPGAESCAGATSLAREVEQRLGRHALVSPSQADLSIEGRAERSNDSRWRAVIELRDSHGLLLGTRELATDGPDCGPLMDSTALAVALMVDPNASVRSDPVPSLALPIAPAIPDVPASPPVGVPVPWGMVSSIGALVGFGVLPAPAVGVQFDIGATAPRFWEVEAFGRAYESQRRFVTANASVHFAAMSGGLATCPVHRERAWWLDFDLCAGAELAVLESESDGLGTRHSNTVTIFRLLANTHVSVPIAGPLALRAGGELGVALLQRDFIYYDVPGNSHNLFSTGPLTAAADLGVLFSLP